MTLYCGIDLHSNNSVICVINDKDQRLLEAKVDNKAELVIKALSRYKKRLKAVAVESTYNWYWLVDSLNEAGFHVLLVNTARVVQYSGLKRTDDRYDAFHLAHLMRLDILPTGYIYPKATRGLRDLVRKRIQLVQDRSREIIRLKSFIQLHTGETIKATSVKAKKFSLPVFGDQNTQLSLKSSVIVIRSLTQQIKAIEKAILQQVESSESFANLKTVPGIGDVLAETILLETGDISRFDGPGNFASYARCVESRRTSNGKSKATNVVVARKALAHKIARACYWIMRKGEVFDESRLFA